MYYLPGWLDGRTFGRLEGLLLFPITKERHIMERWLAFVYLKYLPEDVRCIRRTLPPFRSLAPLRNRSIRILMTWSVTSTLDLENLCRTPSEKRRKLRLSIKIILGINCLTSDCCEKQCPVERPFAFLTLERVLQSNIFYKGGHFVKSLITTVSELSSRSAKSSIFSTGKFDCWNIRFFTLTSVRCILSSMKCFGGYASETRDSLMGWMSGLHGEVEEYVFGRFYLGLILWQKNRHNDALENGR